MEEKQVIGVEVIIDKLTNSIENAKMNDKDIVFVNRALTEKEDKEFSDFLKTRKKKTITTGVKATSKPIGNTRTANKDFTKLAGNLLQSYVA